MIDTALERLIYLNPPPRHIFYSTEPLKEKWIMLEFYNKYAREELFKLSSLSALLLCFSFLNSFFYKGVHFEYVTLSYAFLIASIALQLFSNFKNGILNFTNTAFVWFLLGFWLLALTSLGHSISFLNSYNHFWVLSIFPIILFLGVFNADQNFQKISVFLFLAVILMLCFWAYYQIFFIPQDFDYRASGPYFNPNLLAGILNVSLFPVMAYFLIMDSRDKIRFYLCYGIVVIIAGAMMATMSRTGLISATACFALLALLLRKHDHYTYSRVGLLLLTGVILNLLFHQYIYNLRESGGAGGDYTFFMRLLVWESSVDIFLLKPFWGWGLATFQFIYPQFRNELEDSTGYFTHMDSLQFSLELGILAPILFYGALISGLVLTVKAVRYLEKPSVLSGMIIGLFCGICALLIHSHLSYHLYIFPNLFALGFACTIWLKLCGHVLEKNKPLLLDAGKKKMITAGFVLIALIALHGASIIFVNQNLYERAEEKWRDNDDIVGFVNTVNLASIYSFGQDPNAYLEIAKMQTALLENPSISLQEKSDIAQSTLSLFDKAIALNEYDPSIYYNRGIFYDRLPEGVINESHKKAVTEWQKALELNKRYMPAREKLKNVM